MPVRGSSRPVAVGRAPLPADEETPVQYKLFRFTDFDVQPGHSYRYRVQLVLKNPNFGVSADALANPNVKPEPYRDTPWSEFSGTASVPASPRLLAASIDRTKGKEARGRVGILAWKKDSTEARVAQPLARLLRPIPPLNPKMPSNCSARRRSSLALSPTL